MGAANVLVDTAWVAAHLDDPQVRLLQADEDALLYDAGHIPGAGRLRWDVDLQAPHSRDVLDPAAFVALMGRLGIGPATTVVLYGDRLNGWATYAYWVLRYRGHADVRLMDGGHARWAREGRLLAKAVPTSVPADYPIPAAPTPIRATGPEVLRALGDPATTLIDARPRPQYDSAIFPAIGYPATGAHRGGHIPGAINIPWTAFSTAEGVLKSAGELRQLYADAGADLGRPVIAYCIVGVGSSFTYFILRDLLGHPDVRNYDGSWMEWGSTIGYPVATAQ
jgi:thiosulfate/3-mercaptopyruvate sulfurtransferase